MVEPWLTPQSLSAANPDALASLVLNCRAIRTELFGPEREWSLPGWVPFLVVLVALVGRFFGERGRGVTAGI